MTTRTQYMNVDDFPIEKDGCNSAEKCGSQEWECRVADNPLIVRLKWKYPIRQVLYSCVGVFCTILFGTSAMVNFFRERALQQTDGGGKAHDAESASSLDEVVSEDFLRDNIPFFSSEQFRPRYADSDRIRRPPTAFSRAQTFIEHD